MSYITTLNQAYKAAENGRIGEAFECTIRGIQATLTVVRIHDGNGEHDCIELDTDGYEPFINHETGYDSIPRFRQHVYSHCVRMSYLLSD